MRFGALELQHAPIRDRLVEAFDRLLDSSGYILGAEVEAFEHEFAEYCGVKQCVGVSSGTSALTLMLRAYNIGPGDEVIVPAHTFIASALAVAHVGATPVLCDVLENTGLINPDAVRAGVGPRTVGVLAVHLYGQACDMEALRAVTKPHGLLLLEDAAQAAGARYRDRPVGSLGAAAGFSFYPGKNLGALGDGGAVCTDDALLASRLRRLRNLGQRVKGEHVELGFNDRLDGLQAALLRIKLEHLDEWNQARRARASDYRELLPEGTVVVEEQPETVSIHHIFATRFEDRDWMAARLSEAGIETGVHYDRAVHQHSAWDHGALRHDDLPVAEAWAAEELSLPMHSDLTRMEVERVARAIERAQVKRTGQR